MDIAAFFDTAVHALNRNKSAELGNRKLYIGSSDVGSCARKVYLQRKTPKTPDVSTLLRFSRGHIAETLIENIFVAGGVKDLFDTQVEVRHPSYPLKAHIDFLFYADLDGSHELHVVEVKSVSSIPDEPYPQWIDQLHFQLGLLRIQYPQGKIGGSVLAIDLNAGQIRQFNGYEYDPAMFNYLVNKAVHLMDCLEERDEAQPSVSRSCAFCPYRSDCPAMSLPKVELPDEIEALACRFAELNTAKRQVEREMKGLRQELLDFTGPVFRGRSDTVDLVASPVDPGLIVDSDRLKLLHPDIYSTVLKERAGYIKLECKQAPTVNH